jgi:hypothetical protein
MGDKMETFTINNEFQSVKKQANVRKKRVLVE